MFGGFQDSLEETRTRERERERSFQIMNQKQVAGTNAELTHCKQILMDRRG